ncbi:hypothetical protein E5Q_05164 [Mixia osmundae IAM 14324]|uniref:Translation initiation factor eIF2B subunit beta n=1 Tax=Mixia osmundae (strain CBS 9802 / IAM 14324 / JCM 22182 / KY 12970) TaxID=764103 RepID=G7E6L8_MIXOS|nr:hypothetical protein E5Q_05164 [Mixia osmundae IAM 14324]
MTALPPATDTALDVYARSLSRRQVLGSYQLATTLIRLLHLVVSSSSFDSLDELVSILRAVGAQLDKAAGKQRELVLNNVLLRVVRNIQEEYSTALAGHLEALPLAQTTTEEHVSSPVSMQASPISKAPSVTNSASKSALTQIKGSAGSTHSLFDLLGHRDHAPASDISTSTTPRHTGFSPSHSSVDLSQLNANELKRGFFSRNHSSEAFGPPDHIEATTSKSPRAELSSSSTSLDPLQSSQGPQRAESRAFDKRIEQLKPVFCDAITDLLDEVETSAENIGAQAPDHIHSSEIILTLAHSKTVETFLKTAHAKKRRFTVVVAESAPSFTGRSMALALSNAGIDTVLLPDAAVFALMSRVSKVILGAHNVLADGSFVAHTGALPICRIAKAHLVPVVICAGVYKFSHVFMADDTALLDFASPTELLAQDERKTKPRIGLHGECDFVAPYFDRVPSQLVSLFITNLGAHPAGTTYKVLQDLLGA